MSEIIYFVSLPFDLVDGGLAAGEPGSKAALTGWSIILTSQYLLNEVRSG